VTGVQTCALPISQAWLVERRLMDREAYDIANGLKVPGDDANGPTGNIHRMVPKK
jgi:hypothetical protein